MPGSKERQRKRARERYERQRAARIARQRKIRQWTLIGITVVVVLGLGIGLPLGLTGSSAKTAAGKKPTASPSPSTSTAAVKEPASHCTYTKASGGTPKAVSLPPAAPDNKSAFTAAIHTSLGTVGVSLLNAKATCAVNSFTHLAAANFWSNTQCHRVSNSGGLYMLQCGDPNAQASQKLSCSSKTLGTGGPGYQFADENLTGATYKAGTVAMANSGPNTNGSQFFLVFKDTQLPASYTPFGTITSGLDILQNVAKAGTSCAYSAGGGVPKEKVVIKNITIQKT